MAHFDYPSKEDLEQFESAYAGPNTKQLEAMSADFVRNGSMRNQSCLICFEKAIKHKGLERTVLYCKTCPRVMHMMCFKGYHQSTKDATRCPLCVRRGWKFCDPSVSGNPAILGDELLMQRFANKAKWENAIKTGEIVREQPDLIDDGTMDHDRDILLALGIFKEDKMLFLAKPDDGHGEAEEEGIAEEVEVAVKTEEHTNASETLQDFGRNTPEVQEAKNQLPEHGLTEVEVRAIRDRLKNKPRKR